MSNGDWIQTYSGGQFWPFAPREQDVRILDIARALSNICRFNGHCHQYYSVAQHSVIMSRISENPLWALLHDAAEAYTSDLASPIKRCIPQFREIEDGIERAIASKFRLEWPKPIEINTCDKVLLATEVRDLMAPPPVRWGCLDGVEPLGDVIVPVDCKQACHDFLARFDELWGGWR